MAHPQSSSNIIFTPAYELADAIRQKRVSAVEVVEAHLAQIAQHNSAINVIVTLDETARAQAQEADAALERGEIWGPLHGVPFTAKDGFATKGLRTTSGNPAWANFVPQVDAPVVARLRSAGAILLGKTNLPMMSYGAHADNPIFGRTNNPWNLERTSGGSTTGAAAVASGMTPLELGSDLAGSLRIPAHYCGIYSLKPTDYRFPAGGYHPNPGPELANTGGPAGLGVFGPVARCVDDLVLAYQLLSPPEPGQWFSPPVATDTMPVLKLNHMRLAWIADVGGIPISHDVKRVLTDLVAKLEPLVSRVENIFPQDFDFASAWRIWGELVPITLGLDAETVALIGAHAQSASAMDRGLAKGAHLTLQEYWENLRVRSGLITVLERFLSDWDALILPVTATPAFPHCLPNTPILVDGKPLDFTDATIACTCPFNVTGHPVVTLPAGLSEDGLPIGVQIVGRRWGEMQLLGVAKQIAELIGPYQPPLGISNFR